MPGNRVERRARLIGRAASEIGQAPSGLPAEPRGAGPVAAPLARKRRVEQSVHGIRIDGE